MISLLLVITLSQTPPAWPELTVRWTVPIEGKQKVGGWEVQLQRLSVAQEPDEVLSRFLRSFLEAGLFIPGPADQVQLYKHRQSLTALEPKTMTSYTVTVWRAEGSTTQVLTSSSVAVAPSAAPASAAALLPASAQSVFHAFDEGHATCSFDSKEAPDAVKRAMEGNAKRAGYRSTQDADAWQFERDGEHIEARVWIEGGLTRGLLMIYRAKP